MSLDYFTEFDRPKEITCVCCNDCKCEDWIDSSICKKCMLKYANEFNSIYGRIKNYYKNISMYNADFVKEERAKANKDIEELKKKYKIII